MNRTILLITALFVLVDQSLSQACLVFVDQKCTICLSGYNLNQSDCEQNLANCLTYSKELQCLACKAGFKLIQVSKVCVPAEPNASTISQKNNSVNPNDTQKSDNTSNRQASQIFFEQQLNISKFKQIQNYTSILKQIQRSYKMKINNSKIIKVALAQNSTQILYQIIYKRLQTQPKYQIFLVSFNKFSRSFQLISNHEAEQSKYLITQINDQNRVTIIKNLETVLKSLITIIIPTEKQYDASAKLVRMSSLQYTGIDSGKKNESTFRYTFKYRNPSNNSKYQYKQFRFQLTNNKHLKMIGNLLYPYENFIKVPAQNSQIKSQILVYVDTRVFKKENTSLSLMYQILDIQQSKDRENVYRVSFNISQKSTNASVNASTNASVNKVVIYEIDFQNDYSFPYQIKSISKNSANDTNSNKTISGNTSSANSSSTANSTTSGISKFNISNVNTNTSFFLTSKLIIPLQKTANQTTQAIKPTQTLTNTDPVLPKTLPTNNATQPISKSTNISEVGCKVKSAAGNNCVQCSNQFYLHSDSQCYLKLPNCIEQSKDLCVGCEIGFIVNSSQKCERS